MGSRGVRRNNGPLAAVVFHGFPMFWEQSPETFLMVLQSDSVNKSLSWGACRIFGVLRWHVGQEASKQLLLTTKANAVLILPFTYIYTSFCTSISITVLSSNLNMSLRHSIGIHSEGIFSAKWTKRCPNPTRVMSPTFGYCCVA